MQLVLILGFVFVRAYPRTDAKKEEVSAIVRQIQ